METITSSTQAFANYVAAADAILKILDNYKFTTDTPFDAPKLKREIVAAIQLSVEGNTNNARVTG